MKLPDKPHACIRRSVLLDPHTSLAGTNESHPCALWSSMDVSDLKASAPIKLTFAILFLLSIIIPSSLPLFLQAGIDPFDPKASAPSELVSFTSSFHGRTMGALALTYKDQYKTPFLPMMPGAVEAKYNDLDSAKKVCICEWVGTCVHAHVRAFACVCILCLHVHVCTRLEVVAVGLKMAASWEAGHECGWKDMYRLN